MNMNHLLLNTLHYFDDISYTLSKYVIIIHELNELIIYKYVLYDSEFILCTNEYSFFLRCMLVCISYIDKCLSHSVDLSNFFSLMNGYYTRNRGIIKLPKENEQASY